MEASIPKEKIKITNHNTSKDMLLNSTGENSIVSKSRENSYKILKKETDTIPSTASFVSVVSVS